MASPIADWIGVAPRQSPSGSGSEAAALRGKDLLAADVGCERADRQDLLLRHGHDVIGQNQEVRELPGFERSFYLLFVRRVGVVDGRNPERFLARDPVLWTDDLAGARLARDVEVDRHER